MNIHYLQHVPFENPGIILEWAFKRNYQVTCTRVYQTAIFPDMKEFDWLIIMGGPMNIYEEEQYPWLKEEKEFIKRAIEENKLILGLCLGAQLIADVIGGRVIKNTCKEIGWFPVSLTQEAQNLSMFSFLPHQPMVFEWHGDTFVDLPKETVHIAYNEACKNQAFVYQNRIFGFQFHLENTWEIISNLMTFCEDEMVEGQYIQSKEYITKNKHFVEQDNEWMLLFLTKLEQLYEEGEI
jgi:GMP synthase-like glutamine amidotransferase